MKAIQASGNKGFTLIEIVVAVGVLALFIGIIYSTFFGTIRAIRTTESLTDSFQPARIVLDRIARDIKGAVHIMNDPRYVFNGTDANDGDPVRDRIDFITSANIITDDDVPQSDLAEVSYYIDPNYIREGYLVRRVDIYPDKEPKKGGDFKIVAENITGLNFKYFYVEPKTDEAALSDVQQEEQKKDSWELLEDEENWHKEWDWKERNFMPILVKIELSLMEQDGNETTFSTVVYLNRDPSTVSAAQQAAQAAELAERASAEGTKEPDDERDSVPRGERRKRGTRDRSDRPPIDKPILEKGNVRPE